jgi:hypothetical protein
MYRTDARKMAKHARKSPAGLTDLITFALLTIQQPLQTIERQFADVRANGAASKYLFGAKREGYAYAVEHADMLHADMLAALATDDVVGAIDLIALVPGLGVVKSAFVAQMAGFEIGCLDRHNLARLGLPETAFKLPKTLLPETRRAKIAAYVRFTQAAATSEEWWNSWCAYVAGRRGSPLKTAAAVSRYHCAAIGL